MMQVLSRPIVRENIQLNETEKKIFERLCGTLHHFGLKNQLRVAGGWVRDKLLGKDCYDIDIALDGMLGSKFAENVRDYLLHLGEEAQGIAVIPCNPDQSKHLETARMRICGTWIDLVNLRCEEYSEKSRIPTLQKYGTAEQDAFRRDLTINSLFYNINTGLIEDCTNRGIKDLKSGIIVTPLPPESTFKDDPLRVLRAIRFAARFGFVLDDGLKKAAALDEVKSALSMKISRERIGSEIDLMISGNQPVEAMAYICEFNLFWVVFGLHPKYRPAISEGCDRLCVVYMDAAWNLIQLVGHSTFNDDQRRLSLYAAMFLPLRKTMYPDKKAKEKPLPVTNHIFGDSLKRKSCDAETVKNIHYVLVKFLSLIPYFASNEEVQLSEVVWGHWLEELVDVPLTLKPRVLTGILLREIKDFWRVSLLVATLLYPPNVDYTEGHVNKNFELERRRGLFQAVEDSIIKLGLDKVLEVRPLVSGKDIMSVLQLKSGGPLVGEWNRKILVWQLAHPLGTADECLEWMKETHLKNSKTK